MLLIIALPCLFTVLTFACLFSCVSQRRSPVRALLLYPLIASFSLTCGFMAWGYHDVFTSKSSTAAIGLVFIPICAAAVAVVGFAVSWALLYVIRFLVKRIERDAEQPPSMVLFVVAIAMLGAAGYIGSKQISRYWLYSTAASGDNTERLQSILAGGIASHDLTLLSRLAKNPHTPAHDLRRIFDACKHSVRQYNPTEYSVFFALAKNPRTPTDILDVLSECQASSIRYTVAIHPGASNATLQKLANDPHKPVRTYAKAALRTYGRAEALQQ